MATVSRSRSPIVLLATTASLVGAAPALAAHHSTVRGCGAPAGSAINEYCDSFPTSTGGTVPKVGSPAVATTLPPARVRQIISAPAAEHKLLTVPADPDKRHKHHRPTLRTASLNAPTSIWSLALTLILILVAIAVVLAALAAERWRRRRA